MQPFAAMTKAVLGLLGEDSFLRGDVLCRVNIEHDVQVAGYENDATFSRSVATIPRAVDPAAGDELVHPEGVFTLDGMIGDNGYTVRYTLIGPQ